MSIPNLFEIGTNELTQDIFLTWLFKWGDSKSDAGKLQDLSREFLNFLIDENVNINKVNIKRQWNKVDIAITVNDEYFIIIEDKVNAKEHGNQLYRYKNEAEKYIGKNLKLICIYLKIEDECGNNVKKIDTKGYRYIYRENILNIFKKYSDIDNDIFQDYYKHIKKIDDESKNFQSDLIKSITKSYRICRGFFKQFEDDLYTETGNKKKLGWQYVAQKNGGFYGLWYYWVIIDEIEVFIQLEVNKEKAVAVYKARVKDKNVDDLRRLFRKLKETASKYNISLIKPARFKIGNSSTVAIVENVFSNDYKTTYDNIRKMEKVLDEYVKPEI